MTARGGKIMAGAGHYTKKGLYNNYDKKRSGPF